MPQAGVSRAVLCAFDASPDLEQLHQALIAHPDMFRLIGVPIGIGRAQVSSAVAAQFAAGFSAVRLSDSDLAERSWLLDVAGEARGIVVVAGASVSEPLGARVLLDHLNRHADAQVVAAHFAGPRDGSALRSGAVNELFEHPRFSVVFSRHGAFEPSLLRSWAEAVLQRTGWQRALWGMESPVLYWRNESVQSSIDWIDELSPTDDQRAAFFGGNADRIFFAPERQVASLQLDFDPWLTARKTPAPYFAGGLALDQAVGGRLVRSWLASGGPSTGTLGAYVEKIIDKAVA
ncbi:MAG: hypothetical protein JWQ64_2407 [Subtercola sp.]|nr:hypothetical protein [Subtercola sp.]